MAMSRSIENVPPSALPPLVRLGEVIAEKYRLERILGAGGMGVVVGATHLQLDQRIAIKFMSPVLLYNEGGIERFMQEARLAARIQCEHVVRVFDVDSLADCTPYIVMEYLEGEDLRALLVERGRLSVGAAVDCVLQAGEAIAEAHVAGIVHRDLKPGNLFCCKRLDRSRLIKVLDFGVSKLLPKADVTLHHGPTTGPHAIVGSPAYSSPEQMRMPGKVDARADIWSLGAILYELLAGRPPFSGATFLELCTRVCHEAPTSLRVLSPGVPPALATIVERSLAKDPADRFQTVAELARALAPFARHRSQLSIERIENVSRGAAMTTGVRSTPLASRSLAEQPYDKTLPSQPDPSGDARKKGTRLRASPRWTVVVAVASVVSAVLGAAVAFVATRPSAAPAATARAVEPVSPATNVPSPPSTSAHEPTSLVPLADSAAAPVAAPARTAGAARSGSPPRRVPDTSQFGGLQ
jgi:serine/threonine-protein kinase